MGTVRSLVLVGVVVGVAGLPSLACKPGQNLASQTLGKPEASALTGDQARCSIVPTQKKPLIVEWPSTERGALEGSIDDGLIVIRYSGCEMEVLGQCRVRGQGYAYKGFTEKSESISIRNKDDLYARVPIGAARLEGRLDRGETLTASMTTVGMFQAKTVSVTESDLEGICDGATHFVHRVQVGAYQFYANQSAALSGEVGVEAGPGAGVGVGAGSEAERETLARDGNAEACKAASRGDDRPPPGCGAPLRLEVVELGARNAEVKCPAGSAWDGSHCAGTTAEHDQFLHDCDSGTASSCVELGYRYSNGEGVAFDPARALELWGKGCDRGDARGCLEAAVSYARGEGVAKDARQAFALYQKACDGGRATECLTAGDMAASGKEVTADPLLAATLYGKACDRGDPRGCALLADKYYRGSGVAQDHARAVQLREKACDGNVASACFELGLTSEDKSRARELYFKACEGNVSGACGSAAFLLERGIGGPTDEARAAELRKKAAELDRKACDAGNAVGCDNLGLAYDQGKGVEQDEGRAAELFDQACKGGSRLACWRLGSRYEKGEGVKQDYVRALGLYLDTCERKDMYGIGCGDAARMYESGLGVKRDVARAKELRKRGCDLGQKPLCKSSK